MHGSRAQMSDEFSEVTDQVPTLVDTGPGGEYLLWNGGRSSDVRGGEVWAGGHRFHPSHHGEFLLAEYHRHQLRPRKNTL